MNNENYIKIIIIVVLLYLIICGYKKQDTSVKEGYGVGPKYSNIPDYSSNSYWDSLWVGNLESDCYNLNAKDCTNATNCGLCYRGNRATCVPGDSKGALFEEKCDKWKYTNYYDRKYVNGKICRKVLPWSHRYPEYEYANLQRPF